MAANCHVAHIFAHIFIFISQVFLMFFYSYTATDNKSNSITIDKDDMLVATYRTMEEQREVHEKEINKEGQMNETSVGSRRIWRALCPVKY